jgi:hypothetical protein
LKSTDGGSTWINNPVFDHADSYGVSSISISPLAPETIVAGIYYYSGKKGYIVKSTGSSEIYHQLFETSVPVNCVKVHPAKPDTIYAGTGNFHAPVTPGALYKSTDGGKTWRKTSLTNVVVNSISITASEPEIVYAGCGGYDYSCSGIYKSTDGGKTWDQKKGGLPFHGINTQFNKNRDFAVTDIDVDNHNNKTIYAALYDQGTYVSIDGGNYWTRIGFSDYFTYDINNISLDHWSSRGRDMKKISSSRLPSIVVVGTSSGLFKSTNSGCGIISGSIIPEDTSALLNNAKVSSGYGSDCLSVDGYYMLIVPPGVFTLQVDCAGYLQTIVPSVTVLPGQSVTKNITMKPVNSDNNSICLVKKLLNKSKDHHILKTLKYFRDMVLKKTDAGKDLVGLYYKTGGCIWQLLKDRPSLKKLCANLIYKLMPMINSSVKMMES